MSGTSYNIIDLSNTDGFNYNHDTNTLSLDHNDADNGAILNGDCTLAKYNMLTLIWDSEFNRWLEISRNF